MLVIAKTLTNITLASHVQQIRQQTKIKSSHTCILIDACNRINPQKQNKNVENGEVLKYCQLNIHPKKGTITKSY